MDKEKTIEKKEAGEHGGERGTPELGEYDSQHTSFSLFLCLNKKRLEIDLELKQLSTS